MLDQHTNIKRYTCMVEGMYEPGLEIVRTFRTEFYSGMVDFNTFLFILQGECNLHYDYYPTINIRKNEFAFCPYGCFFEAEIKQKTSLVVIRVSNLNRLYSLYDLQSLNEENQNIDSTGISILHIKEVLLIYLKVLFIYLGKNVSGKSFYSIKLKELYILLANCYTKKELATLFKHILNRDFDFADFVFQNWKKIKSARELAELSFYSESAFNRKFKDVFGMTPYRWLNRQRAEHIQNELKYTDKPFKIIAEECSFNTLQQFYNYCHCHFKKTPREIRRSVT